MRMFKHSLRALAAAVAGLVLVSGSGVSLAATEAEFEAAYDAMLDDPEFARGAPAPDYFVPDLRW